MATTASPMSALTLQGALYTRRTLKSPMAQLTSLKSAIPSASVAAPASSITTTSTLKLSNTSELSARNQNVNQGLGVPGRPGSGLLDRPPPVSRKHPRAGGMVRPDLGTVLGSVPPKRSRESSEASPSPGTLGTISSILFGRKGGLL